jgi:hypothetical protein
VPIRLDAMTRVSELRCPDISTILHSSQPSLRGAQRRSNPDVRQF